MSVSRAIEIWATAVVQHYVGSRGVVRHTGDGHDIDFRIDYVNGCLGIGEVGAALDPAREQQWSRVLSEPTPQRVELTPGSGQWGVGLTSATTRIDHFLDRIQALIDELNAGDRTELQVWPDWPPAGHDPVIDLARHAGVRYASRVSGDPDGSSCTYFPPSLGGFVPTDASTVLPWLDEYLAREAHRDYVDKLIRLNADERHLFIVVGEAAPFDVQQALMRAAPLPDSEPRLPAAITHLWLTARLSGPSGPVVWLNADSQWRALMVPRDLVATPAE